MAKTVKRKPGSRRPLPAYATLRVTIDHAVASVVLDRPDVHNAFDETSIAELTAALRQLGADDSVRAVVLAGTGTSFCAGADLRWMKRMATFSDAQNLADARALAGMLTTLNELPKPTIARVHGAAFGGGVGLIACCDIAIATQDAEFAFSEARLGLVPATIAPYVVAAIGERPARRLFLTAERFSAAEAFRLGLLHDLAMTSELDARIGELLHALLRAGPRAQAECKTLLRAVSGRPIDVAAIEDTAARIARVRASAEGREGVAAFLARRNATWITGGE
ncbi:MAG TPA: enoyl-CoA hydratase/isomerase family protein [Casimicrobiaceae bacterium]|jgi:methylglutaconyl-CoA hydratase